MVSHARTIRDLEVKCQKLTFQCARLQTELNESKLLVSVSFLIGILLSCAVFSFITFFGN